jgi:asparaginyl-tRNA synthetase
MQTYISEIGDYEGKTVTLKGWLYNARSGGKIRFLLVRDGTGIIQCVASLGDVGEKTVELIDSLTQESSIIVTGTVRADKRAPGGFELVVSNLELVGRSNDYPISPKEHGTAFLMENRHLWLRSRRQNAILHIRHEIVRAIRNFFDDRGFVLFDTPIFTPAACEGTSTLFETDYFGEKAYLAQSGQLYAEAGAMALGKVYCFGPTFRAEKSKTRRHLTEFWIVEPEVAYLDLDGDMKLAEDFVSYIVERVLENRQEELKIIERDTTPLEEIRKPFPRVSYTECVDILKKNGLSVEWGDDFGGDEETVISSQFDSPVLVHRFPAAVKAFYMKNDPEDEKLVLGFDMLAPEGRGEIIGGGQREEDYDKMVQKIRTHELPIEAFDWYLDLRKYGTVPHSGFGLGLERTVGWICGLSHVRETIPFPRMLHRLKP